MAPRPQLVRNKIPAEQLSETVHSRVEEELRSVASHTGLSQDIAQELLKRMDLSGEVLQTLAANGRVMKYRKVRLAVVMHQKTPRFVSIPLLRHLYTFELMQMALIPIVPADIKRASEDQLEKKISSLTSGERMTLAKQGSTRTAAILLQDKEERVIKASLNNPRMTEQYVVQALLKEGALQILILAVCLHAKWSLRKDVRGALLRNAHTPLAHAITSAQSFRLHQLKELFHQSKLPEKIQHYLLETARNRKHRGHEQDDGSVNAGFASRH
jgi:hypothetical protein